MRSFDSPAGGRAAAGVRIDGHTIAFRGIAYVYLSVFALACFIPFWLVIAGSVTPENEIFTKGYQVLPASTTLEAYRVIFRAPERVLRAYGVSIGLTASGTVVGLFITVMTAYALSSRDCRYRRHLAFYFYFTMLFYGGLTPFYILMVRTLELKDTFWAMFFPLLLDAWFILLTRSFLKTIPYSIIESAKIDGASHFTIFFRIVIPLSTPALATIGLFIALRYWNDWYHAMLFVERTELYPLQYFLYRLLNAGRFADAMLRGASLSTVTLPEESIKMAMAVVATGPIVLVYPFVQKYFVKGLIIGSVKG